MKGLKLYHIPETPLVVLLEDYYFTYQEEVQKIPKGFAFDGASIPRIFHTFASPLQYPYIEAGLQHDYLYSELTGEQVREDVDGHLYRTLKEEGKPIMALLFYMGVYCCGGCSWKKDLNYKKYETLINEHKKLLNL